MSVLSLCPPLLAVMARHPSEVGYVSSVVLLKDFNLTLSSPSVRFGISWFLVGFGALMGNPVTGALLGQTYDWSKALLWCGVSILPYCSMNYMSYTIIQISGVIATIGLFVTRQLFYRKKLLEAANGT
jgi:hypothetical protein